MAKKEYLKMIKNSVILYARTYIIKSYMRREVGRLGLFFMNLVKFLMIVVAAILQILLIFSELRPSNGIYNKLK